MVYYYKWSYSALLTDLLTDLINISCEFLPDDIIANITANWTTTETERETGGCYPQLTPMSLPQKQKRNLEGLPTLSSKYWKHQAGNILIHTHTSAAAYTSPQHTHTHNTAAVSLVCQSLAGVLGWRMIYRVWQRLCGVGKSTESAVLTDPIHPSKH